MFHLFRFLRLLGRFALIVYFLVGIALLGLRYWLLPNVDQWRGTIETQLSQALGAQVTLGEIKAQWLGANPRLTLSSVSIRDPGRGEILNLPYLRAVLSWRSVADANLRFARLEVSGLDLTLRRDAQNRLWVLGQAIDLDGGMDDTSFDAGQSIVVPPALAWLMSQPSIDFDDVTLRWLDERRNAPPLILHRANLQLQRRGGEHRFSLAVSPPASLATAIEVRGELRPGSRIAPDRPLARERLKGRLYARVDGLVPTAWRPWLDAPQTLTAGRLSAQASLGIAAGRLGQVSLDASLQGLALQQEPANSLGVEAARLHVEGPWDALAWAHDMATPNPPSSSDAASGSAGAQALQFQLQMAGVKLKAQDVFAQPLQFDKVRFNGWTDAADGGHARLGVDEASLLNADLDLTLKGTWQSRAGTEAGVADLTGQFRTLRAPAIVTYLPLLVDADARDWMRTGLLAGRVQDATLRVQGELEHFPFGDAPDKGDFAVDGKMADVVIDYVPPSDGELGWPRLEAVQGRLNMRRVALRLQADSANMVAGPSVAPIVLSGVQAVIPNIERDAELTVDGTTRAAAASYLSVMRHSPLGALLDGVFDEAQGNGQWEVPLSLKVPLMNSLDTTVTGEVRFAGGSLQLMPEMPAFTRLRGAVAFTETGIAAQAGLGARFLGGNVAVTGGLGGKQPGLRLTGRLQANALRDYVGLEGMKRLRGETPYSAWLSRDAQGELAITLQSDLTGLSLDFPKPLGKPAGQALPLTARWHAVAPADSAPARNGRAASAARPVTTNATDGGALQALDVTLGSLASVHLLHQQGQSQGPYFHAGAMSVRQALPQTPAQGLALDVQDAYVDIGQWKTLIEMFSLPLTSPAAPNGQNAQDDATHRPLLPEPSAIRVRGDRVLLHGLDMQQAELDARRADAGNWRLDIRSKQTEGTLHWREADGRVEGHVQAQFTRMAVGTPAAERSKDGPAKDGADAASAADADASAKAAELDIPAIDLQVQAFTLYGHQLGKLSLTGLNQARGQLWKLERLSLTGAGLQLQGAGQWHLSGEQRGLNLDATADISNMGAYLSQLGINGIMTQGQGRVEGSFFWHDLPWSLDVADIQGTIKVALDKGRFSRLHSRVARLLELLSFQSLQRLARLDVNLNGAVRDGFPFDALRGDLILRQGMLDTQDYRVIGPVGTIVLGGRVDLREQTQNLQAVVIPNLDVSGAALAAGIAINPIVGVGAFLAQWLLQAPLAKAMTLEYQIGGTWDDPELQEVKPKEPATTP